MLLTFLLSIFLAASLAAQDTAQKIFETEKGFEKLVSERGIRDGFIQFLSPAGVMFMPDAVNAREAWRARAPSNAALTWNPVWIDVSANGALAYSIGNSRYRPKGRDDSEIFYGHYLSVWMKQPNGRFLAALDTGIRHEKPASEPVEFGSPTDLGKGSNPEGVSAADSAVAFYEVAAASGAAKAYKQFLAFDAIALRDGKLPAFGKKAALSLVKSTDGGIRFAKRKSFTEAIDLGYVHSGYTIVDSKGVEIEKGNFVQVWKFRNGKWLIVADVLVPLPKSGG